MNAPMTAGYSPLDLRRNVMDRVNEAEYANGNDPQGDHFLNPALQNRLVRKGLKEAAVLIPVIERNDGLNVVFTKRTEALKSHSGQVSFPGGKIDPGDQNAKHAALRETHEEIGVDHKHIEVLGQLPDYFTGSGYQIAPIIGMVEANARFEANPEEVDFIFEVPLSFLMNPDHHEVGTIFHGDQEWFYYEMNWDGKRIWGVTAGIVRMFYNQVFK